ncbi:MAG: 2Fe-2S iron-sulfur cluster binding domain-containing protein [Actinobacteria bacterium]|nr:2Fe-2S iron-sulfur cluster binding domain-containing protein [Actinomycetota bacterium]
MNDAITINVNNKDYSVESGQTVMQALDKIGYHIPRLCYHPKLSVEGACRICIVEVEGSANYVTSCTAKVAEGMKIKTNSAELRKARRDILELLLDSHPVDCNTCERDGNCELQSIARSVGIKKKHFEGERKHYDLDLSSPAISRDPNKCILCGRCVRLCNEIQGVTAINFTGRGFDSTVTTAYNSPINSSVCINCGQCINVCPTAALSEKYYNVELFKELSNEKKLKIVQIAPAVRAAIGEAFGLEPGVNMEKQTVAALRKLGFDLVFDTQFSADLTIMEEGYEFLDRVANKGVLPMITSCSPAWIKYAEQFHPEIIPNISTCKSPMSMMSSVLKTYFAKKRGIDPKDILSVAIMPCTAKKYEAQREELKLDGIRLTDIVLTTRELAWIIKSAGIDLVGTEEEEFDNLFGFSSGAAPIFGVTGGVMEAALRTAYELYVGETVIDIEFKELRGFAGIKEAEIKMGDKEVRVAVAHGIGNANKILEIVRKDPGRYQFIEVMSCPGGCIMGGGQPYPVGTDYIALDEELMKKRASVLYGIDRAKTIRRSHENPEIQRIYKEFFERPLGPKSHHILHTSYEKKLPHGIYKK